MSLHADLLRQARQLATRERRRPLQASLRRGVSASYYALFHLLVHEATSRMVTGVVWIASPSAIAWDGHSVMQI